MAVKRTVIDKHTHKQTGQAKSEKCPGAFKQEHGDVVLQSVEEVTKSKKPIKKMINIHEGDAVYVQAG